MVGTAANLITDADAPGARRNRRRRRRRTFSSRGERIFNAVNVVVMVMVIIAVLYPFVYIISLSLSDHRAVVTGEVFLLPIGFDINAYRIVLDHPSFLRGYLNTIIITTLGTAVSMTMTVLCAYPLSKPGIKGTRLIMKLIVFTLLFPPGLIPTYLLVSRGFALSSTLWAVILPFAIVTWNMIVMRTFFQGLPREIEEAALMDGLQPFGILLRIVLPLSKAILATIGLFYAVEFWNDWFRALIYLNRSSLFPITLFLRNIIVGAGLATDAADVTGMEMSAEGLKAAAIVLVALPIVIVYPFIQKYFEKGMLIGSVKG